jgi:hypothetical protein
MAPNKAQQELEAEARMRATRSGDPTDNDLNAHAVEVATDDTATDPPVDPITTTNEDTSRRPPALERTKGDRMRDEIVARMREQRQQMQETDTDEEEIRRFARQGIPPELLDEEEAGETPGEEEVSGEEPAEVNDQVEEPPPDKKFRAKVRGKEILLSEKELIDAAQIALAHDDYLTEAKTVLNEVKALRNDLGASRAQPGIHPTEGANVDATSGTTQTPPADTPDPYTAVVEKLQFGDQAEAARELKQLLATESSKLSQKALLDQRMADEVARNGKTMQDFKAKYPELVSDPIASAAIEAQVLAIQRADLEALGLDPNQIPRTSKELTEWHLFYRANGNRVKSDGTMLQEAVDRFNEWRGPKKDDQEPPQARKVVPRIDMSQDRVQRRASLPQQPTRAVTPRQDSQRATPQPRDRSEIVRQMVASRNKPRGKAGLA